MKVRVDTVYNEDDPNSMKYPPVVDGPSAFSPTAGVFNVSGVRFTGVPG